MNNKFHSNLSIIEAVETLSNIADLEFDKEIGIAESHEMMLQDEKINYKTVHWLHQQDATTTVQMVKETFRVVLHYLRQFYKREYGQLKDQKTIDGIKTIMVLVGEAAKKLDKYTEIFHKAHLSSVTELKEYKQLQEFYLNRIAKHIDEGVLGKWILGLSFNKPQVQPQPIQLKGAATTSLESKHVFVDLETVKKDTEYELFFVRKEDGSRFFSPRLLRNIKLVCDFGVYFGENKIKDPLEDLKLWQDHIFHICARNILRVVGSRVEYFFHEMRKVKNNELVVYLNKALLALMLCSHSQNFLKYNPTKSCTGYFADFQQFLRQALRTHIYQKWISYPPEKSNKVANDLLEIVHVMCRAIYLNLQGLEELHSIIHHLVEEAKQNQSSEHQEVADKSRALWNILGGTYAAMSKLIKKHPNGPLLKVLDILEEDAYHVFDPLMQHNVPSQLFDLYVQDKRISHIRFASPTYQEFINKACINEEFKGMLRHYLTQTPVKRHLLFNLQDKTSWREHSRCEAIEEVQFHENFAKCLCVVTLPYDTDFYYQLAPYHQMNQAKVFIDQFKEHMDSEHSGFYFPPSIQNKLKESDFIDRTLHQIHRIFFSEKNVLSKEQRLNFIEIFYLFLQIKLLDIFKPDSFSFTCKDGVDVGETNSAKLFVFLKLVNQQEWSQDELDHLQLMIYGPALLTRERILLSDRFNRMLSAIRAMETTQNEMGAERFGKLMEEVFLQLDWPLLQSVMLLPR